MCANAGATPLDFVGDYGYQDARCEQVDIVIVAEVYIINIKTVSRNTADAGRLNSTAWRKSYIALEMDEQEKEEWLLCDKTPGTFFYMFFTEIQLVIIHLA